MRGSNNRCYSVFDCCIVVVVVGYLGLLVGYRLVGSRCG